MPDYRLYCLDSTGKLGFAEDLEAENDEDAIFWVHNMKRHALKCEVWRDRRLVATLDATDLAVGQTLRPSSQTAHFEKQIPIAEREGEIAT